MGGADLRIGVIGEPRARRAPAIPGVVLAPGRVHIWYAGLEVSRQRLARYEAVLSPDEWDRVRRIRDPEAARRFVVRRGVLRHLLARYLGVSPQTIPFRQGPQGKPTLGGVWAQTSVHFSLSDSGELAVYAFTGGHPLGVDLERIRPVARGSALAERHFSPLEQAWFRAQPPERRDEAFLRCWTCKEALVKAVGSGLTVPLGEITVAHWEEPPWVTWPSQERRWRIQLLQSPPGYLAALAIPAEISPVLQVRQVEETSELGTEGLRQGRPLPAGG